MNDTVYYEVETRNKETGRWQHSITCHPPYHRTIERRRFLFFFHRDVPVVTNLQEAEDTARAMALLHAQSYRKRGPALRREARVLHHNRVSPQGTWGTVIWCNGHFREND